MTSKRNDSQSDGGIDLNCREHVSDTESDEGSGDETLIENKVSQQPINSLLLQPIRR